MPGPDNRRCTPTQARPAGRWLGLAGSTLLAVGSLGAGALPTRDPYAAVLLARPLREVPGLAVALVYAGLVLLVLAWLRLGSWQWRTPGTRARGAAVTSLPGPTRELTVTLAWWVAPLLAIPPLFSRDAYSYVAQGAMVGHGLDAYLLGPSALGGPLAADVPPIWQDTPAPYGPVALAAAAAVVWLVDERTVPALLGMRLMALAALWLVVRYLPELARRSGVEPGRALWLALLNPLVLIHLVGGVHNDALMIGFLVAGLVLALRGRWIAAVAVLTLAALVKAPAAVALLIVVPLWAAHHGGRWRLVRASAATVAVAGATAVAVNEILDLGYGWVGALGTPMVVRNGLSLSTNLGYLVGWLPDRLDLVGLEQTIGATRAAALLAALGLTGYLLWQRQRFGLGPVAVTGLALSALVVFGPVVHPWYLTWGIVMLAAGTQRPWAHASVVATSVAMTFVLQPMGSTPEPSEVWGAVVGVAVALLLVRATGTAVAHPSPHLTGARRRPDRFPVGAAPPVAGRTESVRPTAASGPVTQPG